MSIPKHIILWLILATGNLVIQGDCTAQSPEISLFAGFSNYIGDLTQKVITPKNAGNVVGLNFKYPINEKFWLRGSFSKGNISGYDKDNDQELRPRNLSFQTNLTDGYLAMEFRFFSPDIHAVTPYIFTGAGMFRFNPYVYYGDKNEKVYLQPLGTEGQGLPEYPDRKMYDLTEPFIPFGGGLLWTVSDKLILGIEFRHNYVLTDYLDDVSFRYALPDPLLRDRGPVAVALAWRRDEYDGRPYSNNESRRGNPDNNDWYYYMGFHVGFRLPSGSENSSFKKGRNQLGCPKW